MYGVIFLSLFVTGWLLCGLIPWVAYSVATRGRAGMAMLPLCLFAAVVAGIATPVLGLDDELGLGLSFAFATLGSSVLLAARRFALAGQGPGPLQQPTSGPTAESELPEGL